MTERLELYAKQMAELTFQLEKACQEKESYFAGKFELTPAEFRALRHLLNYSHLSTNDLAKLMNLTPGRITHIITSLEKKKFIQRDFDPNDRRSIQVTLMTPAVEFVQRINSEHIKLHQEILSSIPIEKSQDILDALSLMIQALQQWSAQRNKT